MAEQNEHIVKADVSTGVEGTAVGANEGKKREWDII